MGAGFILAFSMEKRVRCVITVIVITSSLISSDIGIDIFPEFKMYIFMLRCYNVF